MKNVSLNINKVEQLRKEIKENRKEVNEFEKNLNRSSSKSIQVKKDESHKNVKEILSIIEGIAFDENLEISQYHEIVNSLKSKTDKLHFIGKLCDAKNSPYFFYENNLLELVFSLNASTKSFQTLPVRKFFNSFKTSDMNTAVQNRVVLFKSLETILSTDNKLKFNIRSLFTCFKYISISVEDAMDLIELVKKVQLKCDEDTLKANSFNFDLKYLNDEYFDKISKAFRTNKFISNDDKKKFLFMFHMGENA
jgi:hypothetical protein